MISARARTDFSGRSPREAEAFIGSAIRPIQIESDSNARYDFAITQIVLGEISISVLRYGAPLTLRLGQRDGDAGDRFYLQLVLNGSSSVLTGTGERIELATEVGHLSSTDAPIVKFAGKNCRHFIIGFDRKTVGVGCGSRRVGLRHDSGGALTRYARYLDGEIGRDSPIFRLPKTIPIVGQTLAALLAQALGEQADPEPGRRQHGRPYYVRRALDFIEANVSEDIGISDIAAAAGVSERTVYRGFDNAFEVGPLEYLRNRRLDCVHAELCEAEPNETTVCDVAFKWGFGHLGAFTKQYRLRFGRLPSQTLSGPG